MQTEILKQFILKVVQNLKEINFYAIFRRQMKRIVASMIIIIIILTYFFTINTRRRMSEDTLYWEKQMGLAKNILTIARSEQEAINILKEQARNYQDIIILPQDQDMLEVAKNYAQRMNMRVINIKGESDLISKFKGANTVIINSKIVRTFTVELEGESGFSNLVRYFDTFYRFASSFVSVERLKISRNKNNSGTLKEFMELRFYSLLQ